MNQIKKIREARGIAQKVLAIAMGVSAPTVSNWESGAKDPSNKNIRKLAEYLGVSCDCILGLEEFEPANPSKTAVRIPVYGRVPAGIPLEAIAEIIDYEEIPGAWTDGGKDYFSLIVKGDSMYPKYLEGDIIIVRKAETCESGQDCVVYVNSHDATLKKVILLDDGGVRLQPINTDYNPRTYYPGKDEPVSIAGVVEEIRRKP